MSTGSPGLVAGELAERLLNKQERPAHGIGIWTSPSSKRLRIRYPGTCRPYRRALAAEDEALWD
jgi:hypothetical protein